LEEKFRQSELDELIDYAKRRKRVLRAMNLLGHGARSRCAFDTRIAHSVITAILNGRQVQPDKLTSIEDWITDQAKTVAANSS
jgi:hypothetical protein